MHERRPLSSAREESRGAERESSIRLAVGSNTQRGHVAVLIASHTAHVAPERRGDLLMPRTRFSVATCNLYNLNRLGLPMYRDPDGWSQEPLREASRCDWRRALDGAGHR
jgi:hypothetical protein